jgi:hypothetical protein
MEDYLIKFASVYGELKEKSLEILKIYGMGDYELEGISADMENGKLVFNINASVTYSGCGTDYDWLAFDLDVMNNDIQYFKDMRAEETENALNKKLALVEAKKQAEQLVQDAKDKSDYLRLKKQFEG